MGVPPHRRAQRGIALAYLGIFLVPLGLVVGLAVDLGRAYAVRLQLVTAVDAAALAAARHVPDGEAAARAEGRKIFEVNFPERHLGVSEAPVLSFDFDTVDSGPDRGAHLINVSASTPLPTTFMRIGGFESVDVAARGQATRRLVDLAFVIDHSDSLEREGFYDDVQAAATQFVDFFDPANDRMALVLFATDAVVVDPIFDSARGFDKSSIQGHIASSVAEGKTSTAEGLFRGWDQLRRVPPDVQAGVRVVVLFTDGAPNMINGVFRHRPTNTSSDSTFTTTQGAIWVQDFPARGGNTTSTPPVGGLWRGTSSCCATLDTEPPCVTPGPCWFSGPNSPGRQYTNGPLAGIPHLPNESSHPQPESDDMPNRFPLETPGLAGQRTLLLETGATATTVASHRYPSHAQNVSKAARNLVETIANEIRSDSSGAHRIRIYTLGLGNLLNEPLGFPEETGSSILQRIANDPDSPDFDDDQPEGKYYFAGDPTQLEAAFQQVRDQIIRLTE